MNRNTSPRFIPLVLSIGIVLGIVIGNFYANHYAGNRLSIINTSSNKINDLLHIIDDQYVDPVNVSDLVEKAMPQILKELDPHSTYVTAKDVEASMQDLKGSFSGIGVQFFIYQDSVRVVRVINGGPSESVGIEAGDRIVSINKKPYVGSKVSIDSTYKLLKGPKGSKIEIQVYRPSVNKKLNFAITRGDVPINSIAAAYMADDTTGYIKVNSFAETTYSEFLAALAGLHRQGFKNLIIDLRGNLGGYLDPAIRMAMEFLPKNRLIVYTQGRRSPRQNYKSDGRGTYQTLPLVVLVDEVSASASEIFAGAIQDNDRGTIIGRRTFGKGLVQEPIQFADGSMLRLTIARYYTPSGRCVQKPYVQGEEEDYENDLIIRAEHGEYYSKDSIKTSGKAYKTRIGRNVYGGGGITPDLFIPRDTLGMTSYFRQAYALNLIQEFAYVYSDNHRHELSRFGNLEDLLKHLHKQNLVEKFAQYGSQHGLKRRNLMLKTSHKLFTRFIYGYIIDNILDEQSAIQFDNQTDPAMQQALKVFEEGKAFPSLTKSAKIAFRIRWSRPVPCMASHFSHLLKSTPYYAAEIRTPQICPPMLPANG